MWDGEPTNDIVIYLHMHVIFIFVALKLRPRTLKSYHTLILSVETVTIPSPVN